MGKVLKHDGTCLHMCIVYFYFTIEPLLMDTGCSISLVDMPHVHGPGYVETLNFQLLRDGHLS